MLPAAAESEVVLNDEFPGVDLFVDQESDQEPEE